MIPVINNPKVYGTANPMPVEVINKVRPPELPPTALCAHSPGSRRAADVLPGGCFL